MENTPRKSIKNKKVVASTPASFASRASIPGSNCKTLPRSESFSSLVRSTPGENVAKNPLEREIEKHLKEYGMYLLRALQAKLLIQDRARREEETKKYLVSLKQEYESLLDENVRLYEQIRVIETYQKSIETLDGELTRAKEVARVLRENEMDEAFRTLSYCLESRSTRMHLLGFKRKDIEDAFSTHVLGFNSDLYGLVKKVEEYALDCKPLLPEIAREIEDIQIFHRENEELKKRCIEIANESCSRIIASNYRKYFKMAVEECQDIVRRRKVRREELNGEISLQGSSDFGKPNSFSTPSN